MQASFSQQLDWIKRHSPRTQRALSTLPDLSSVRLAYSAHLDVKTAPVIEALLALGAQVFLTTCNPDTVQDDMVQHLCKLGAEADAWRGMDSVAWQQSNVKAINWQPTHLCEMGAELTSYIHQNLKSTSIKGGLEATGSGVTRLGSIHPLYPIWNWDDLPAKEGLHNRHMVGLTAWATFFEATRLSLHEKRIVVVGYGLVGQGVADSARAFGGQVVVVENDPARRLQAQFDGWQVLDLLDACQQADVIATATGAAQVINEDALKQVKSGAFILNVGHLTEEIDLQFLDRHPSTLVIPHVRQYNLEDRIIYLMAEGSMFNLTAGWGDSINAFDITLAVMVAGLKHMFEQAEHTKADLYLLPESAWKQAL